MASTSDIFSLLLVISFLWYSCHKSSDNRQSAVKESFVVDNTTGLPSMVADELYRYNGDLEYATNRSDVPVNFQQNIATQRVAPIINPITGRITPDTEAPLGVKRLANVKVANQQYSTRVHDDLSTSTRYNMPLPQFDDLQGGFKNTNIFKKYPKQYLSGIPRFMR